MKAEQSELLPPLPGFWKRFRQHRLAVAGGTFILLVILAAVFAPFLSPYDPYDMNLMDARQNPTWKHPLGTDNLGRDLATRILYGGRVSIGVGLSAVAISTTLGTLIGAIAGFFGGRIDMLVMRVTDVFMSFPLLLLLIAITPIVGASATNVILYLGLFSWMGVARLVRGQFLAVMNELYVEAAVASGSPSWRIILRHVLPNSSAPITVAATLGVANAMLTEAALSFLGLGIQPPTPSWGNLLHSAQLLQVLARQPWQWMGPGFAIAFTVLSINFLGDGLRDALDPRQVIGKKE